MHPNADNQGTRVPGSLRSDAGVGRQVPDPEPGRSVLEQAFPPLDIPDSQPHGRLTRRGALGRLFGLGAGAAAAAVLPVPVQAAPMQPPMPDWLADAPDWFMPTLERLAAGAHNVHESYRGDLAEMLGIFIDGCRPGGYYARDKKEQDERYSVRNEALGAKWTEERRQRDLLPRIVDDRRVAVVRIPKLDRNERRRLRRWIARQPFGAEHPSTRYRIGSSNRRHPDGIDYLDVVAPERPVRKEGYGWPLTPFHYAHQTVAAAHKAVGWGKNWRLEGVSFSLRCSHGGWGNDNERTVVLSKPDGRLVPDNWRLNA